MQVKITRDLFLRNDKRFLKRASLEEFGDTEALVVCTWKGKFLYRGGIFSLEFTCTGHCSCIEAWVDRAEILAFSKGRHMGQSLASVRDGITTPENDGCDDEEAGKV